MTNRKKTVRLDVDKALGKDSYIIARSTIVQRYSALYGDIMEGLIKTKNTTDASTLAIRTPPKKLLEEILGHSLKAEKYEIQEKISAGGMGSLYCIFDKDFQRTSVMKVVLPERRDNAETVTSLYAKPALPRSSSIRTLSLSMISGMSGITASISP